MNYRYTRLNSLIHIPINSLLIILFIRLCIVDYICIINECYFSIHLDIKRMRISSFIELDRFVFR